MNRSAFASALTLILCSAIGAPAFGQGGAKPAAPTNPAPVAKAGFLTPLKGAGTVSVIPGTSKFDPKAKEVITTYKIKNTSSAPIALLKIEEYWYEKGKMVSTDTQRFRQPFQPGEVIEVTTHAPAQANPVGWSKNATFSHAYGTLKATGVKSF